VRDAGAAMEFETDITGREQEIVALFQDTFTASEGAEEGALIGAFVQRLLRETPAQDMCVFIGVEAGRVIAAVVFTRLSYPQDSRTVFLLSPMAVASGRQGAGLGQALLAHALAALKTVGVDGAVTYGDPAFYGKLGFRPLAQADAAAPLPLSQPMGWIGQSLTDAPLVPLKGPSRCVAALDDPALW